MYNLGSMLLIHKAARVDTALPAQSRFTGKECDSESGLRRQSGSELPPFERREGWGTHIRVRTEGWATRLPVNGLVHVQSFAASGSGQLDTSGVGAIGEASVFHSEATLNLGSLQLQGNMNLIGVGGQAQATWGETKSLSFGVTALVGGSLTVSWGDVSVSATDKIK